MKGKVSEWMRKRRIIIASLTWLKYSQIFGWIVSHKNTRIPEEKNSSGHDQLQCLFGANHYLFRFNSAHHFDRVIHQKCRKRIKRLKNTSRKTSMQIIVNVRILFSQKLFSWYIHTWFILKGTYSYIHFFFFIFSTQFVEHSQYKWKHMIHLQLATDFSYSNIFACDRVSIERTHSQSMRFHRIQNVKIQVGDFNEF